MFRTRDHHFICSWSKYIRNCSFYSLGSTFPNLQSRHQMRNTHVMLVWWWRCECNSVRKPVFALLWASRGLIPLCFAPGPDFGWLKHKQFSGGSKIVNTSSFCPYFQTSYLWPCTLSTSGSLSCRICKNEQLEVRQALSNPEAQLVASLVVNMPWMHKNECPWLMCSEWS